MEKKELKFTEENFRDKILESFRSLEDWMTGNFEEIGLVLCLGAKEKGSEECFVASSVSGNEDLTKQILAVAMGKDKILGRVVTGAARSGIESGIASVIESIASKAEAEEEKKGGEE
ncbi:MAG: hypothetical protein ACI30I_04220 [Parabacteroides sp.]